MQPNRPGQLDATAEPSAKRQRTAPPAQGQPPVVVLTRAQFLCDPFLARHCADALNSGDITAIQAQLATLGDLTSAGVTAAELDVARAYLIDAVFGMSQLRLRASERPWIIAQLLSWGRKLIRQPRGAAPVDEIWFTAHLASLGDSPAAAELILQDEWYDDDVWAPAMIMWTLASLTPLLLNKPGAGLAARVYNVLWRMEDFNSIVQLVLAGVDTTTPAAIGFRDARHKITGTHSGFIMPLEHLVSQLVGPAQLPELANEIDPWFKPRLPGVTLVLKALTTRGHTMILTDFTAVQKCSLVQCFNVEKTQGTIWGFEHIRTPYVQAVHKVTKFGAQPVRMMELWEAVSQILTEATYQKLLKEPVTQIPLIVDAAVQAVQGNLRFLHLPVDGGASIDAYIKNFRVQANGYLSYVATAAPGAKFVTAGKRGNDSDSHLGAFGCRAGLWWSLKVGRPIYFVLDGIKKQDVVSFKTLKTAIINTHLNDPANDVYNEVITFCELREIFKNWEALKGLVRFVRLGEFLTVEQTIEVLAWGDEMRSVDAGAAERQAPVRTVFAAQINQLGADRAVGLDNRQVLKVVAKAELLRLAATQVDAGPDVLLECFKECDVLIVNGYLPAGFPADFAATVDLKDPAKRHDAGVALKTKYDASLSPYFKADLFAAIDRHCR